MFVFVFRFADGLQTLQLLHELRRNPKAFKDAFVYAPMKMDATILEITFKQIQWSQVGSNKHRAELKTHGYWRDFLLDLEGKLNFFF